MTRRTIILGAALSLCFLALGAGFRGFVLDDAYIIYRYADHLAHGQGLAWNLGADPVEGYTSFLWVLLNGLAIALRLSPVIFSKAVSALSGLAIIWTLLGAGRKADPGLAAIAAGALALCPSFALLAMQGLETVATAWLLTLLAACSLLLLSRPTRLAVLLGYAAAFFALLLRPDAAPFIAGDFIGLGVVLLIKKPGKIWRELLGFGLIFVVLGGAYMLWRVRYFGYLFPNTFYIKLGSGGLIKKDAVTYLASFGKQYFWPYLLLFAFLIVRRFNPERLFQVLPILLGVAATGAYLVTVIPIQAHAWRYIFPAVPPFFLALIFFGADFRPGDRSRAGRLIFPVLALLLAGWNLRLLADARFEVGRRPQQDRVVIGKRLAGIPGTMFTTESGALPYYSGWASVDVLGLTSEEIAHQGLSLGLLERLNPDLVALREVKEYAARNPDEAVINQYLVARGFVAVAAIHKAQDQYHVYFARKSSPHFAVIVQRLLNVPGLTYGNLPRIISEKRIPLLGSQ